MNENQPENFPELSKIVKKKRKDDIKRFQEQRKDGYKLIEKFIYDNKGKIFGNMAYLKYLENDSKLLEISEYYYDVYMKNNKGKGIQLTDILYKAGYSLVEMLRNYDNSYTIKYNGQKACILYPISENDYNTLESFLEKSKISGCKLKYVIPEILNINILTKICNPRIYISDWEFLYKVLNKSDIIKISTIRSKETKSLLGGFPRFPEILKKLYFYVKNNDVLVIGIIGYLTLINKKRYFRPRFNVFELLSKDPKEELKKIRKELGLVEKDFSERIIKSFIGLHPDKYSLYYKNIKIVDLYDISKEYVPYTIINEVKYGNLDLIKRFLFIGIYISYKIKGGEQLRRRNTLMISELNSTDIPKEISRPYEIKQLFGNIVIPDRQFKIRKFNGKEKYFIYRPELKKK
jgi:hypothetical protein